MGSVPGGRVPVPNTENKDNCRTTSYGCISHALGFLGPWSPKSAETGCPKLLTGPLKELGKDKCWSTDARFPSYSLHQYLKDGYPGRV